MSLFYFIFFTSLIISITSIVYKKTFFLSILISFEIILLNTLIFKFFTKILTKNPKTYTFSLYILTLAAVEASIGISIISLISRKFKKTRIKTTNTLKK